MKEKKTAFELQGLLVRTEVSGDRHALFQIERHTRSLQRVRTLGYLSIHLQDELLYRVNGSIAKEFIEQPKEVGTLIKGIIEKHFAVDDYDFEAKISDYETGFGMSDRRDVIYD